MSCRVPCWLETWNCTDTGLPSNPDSVSSTRGFIFRRSHSVTKELGAATVNLSPSSDNPELPLRYVSKYGFVTCSSSSPSAARQTSFAFASSISSWSVRARILGAFFIRSRRTPV